MKKKIITTAFICSIVLLSGCGSSSDTDISTDNTIGQVSINDLAGRSITVKNSTNSHHIVFCNSTKAQFQGPPDVNTTYSVNGVSESLFFDFGSDGNKTLAVGNSGVIEQDRNVTIDENSSNSPVQFTVKSIAKVDLCR
jgi:ABC-type Fe3+-hydroxamate transport system substrate-binding protein